MSEPAENLEIEPTLDGWILAVALPGVAEPDVTVRATERELHIEASRRVTDSDRDDDFSYRLVLPADVDSDRVHASMAGDVLTVRMPRAERAAASSPTVTEELDVDIVGVEPPGGEDPSRP